MKVNRGSWHYRWLAWSMQYLDILGTNPPETVNDATGGGTHPRSAGSYYLWLAWSLLMAPLLVALWCLAKALFALYRAFHSSKVEAVG